MDNKTILEAALKTLDSVTVSGIQNMNKIAAVYTALTQVLKSIEDKKEEE